MKSKFVALGVALFSQPIFAADIDFKAINEVFRTIAEEVVKTEQIKDDKGQDLIGGLSASFDEKLTDLAAGKLQILGSATLNSSVWAKTPSTLAIILGTSKKAAPPTGGPETREIALSIDLQTDTVALVRHASNEWIRRADPCSDDKIKKASDNLEADFLRDACSDIKQLPSVNSVGDFLDRMQGLVATRVKYLETRLKDGAANSDWLKLELKYEETLLDSLKARKNKDALNVIMVPEKDNSTLYGSTKLAGVSLAVGPNGVALSVGLDSPESAAIWDSQVDELADFAKKLSLPEGHPDKIALKVWLQAQFKQGIQAAKAIIQNK